MRRRGFAPPVATQRNWCTAVEASIEGASPGAKTITLSGSFELILSDAAFIALEAAERANTYSWFRIALADSAAATSRVINVGGYFTQADTNLNGTGPSDYTVTFRASERTVVIPA